MKDQRSRSLKPTTIHGFAQSGDINAFQRMLLNNPSLLNDRNPVVRSLYLLQICNFPPDEEKLLSSYLNYILTIQMAQTPLHVSAGYNNTEIVKFLLNWQGPEKVELEAKNMVH